MTAHARSKGGHRLVSVRGHESVTAGEEETREETEKKMCVSTCSVREKQLTRRTQLPPRATPTPTKRDGAVAKQQGAAGRASSGSLDNGRNRGLSCAAIAAPIIEKVPTRGHCPVWGCSAASVLNRSEPLQATDNDDLPTWKQ